MRNTGKRTLAITIASLVAASLAMAPAAANADTGTTGEVAAALDAVDARNGNLVAEAVPSTVDADSAAQTPSVDIPADPTKGVRLKGKDGMLLTIRMPGARKGDRGKKARNGAVVYGSKGHSVNAVIPGTDGTVQMWTHIRGKRAPETYRYCVDGVSFTITPGGSAVGVDSANQPVAFVPPPTATEKSTGKSVPTSYSTEGNCLIQHVAHKARGVMYPVVADPWWIPLSTVVAAFTVAVHSCGLGYLAGAAWQIFWNGWVWSEVRRAGREGCVEGTVAAFLPIAWFRLFVKR